jgi:hypothetical protein
VPMLEGKVDHVIGVDTHRDRHTAALLDPTGGLLAQAEVPSSQQGYEQLLGFVAERAPGRRCWALEGTGCYSERELRRCPKRAIARQLYRLLARTAAPGASPG